MSELADLSIADAGAGLRKSEFSAVELTKAHLERIGQLDADLNAFICITGEDAIARAEQADRHFARGEDSGPLLGISCAIKDVIDVAGLPTTCHSKLTSGKPASVDATVVARLRGAGAILLGKSALHEFAIGGPAFDLPFPPARNPWDRNRHPGGSTSGGAVAVATGMAMVAVGTDTAGSVRNPATCCGIVGLKPTYDLVSRKGVFPLSFSLDHVGPLTRSVRDCAIVLDAMVGDLKPSDGGLLDDGVKGFRIGVLDQFHADSDVDPEIITAFLMAMEVLQDLGAELVSISPPKLEEFQLCGRTIQQAESYTVHRHWLADRPAEYCELSRRKLAAGAFLGAADFISAQQARRILTQRFHEALAGTDAAISVSSFKLPCRIDDPDTIAATYERHARIPFNVTGDPVVAVPVGMSSHGLPLGVQISSGPYKEQIALRVAHALQTALSMPARWSPSTATQGRGSMDADQVKENN